MTSLGMSHLTKAPGTLMPTEAGSVRLWKMFLPVCSEKCLATVAQVQQNNLHQGVMTEQAIFSELHIKIADFQDSENATQQNTLNFVAARKDILWVHAEALQSIYGPGAKVQSW